MIHKKPSTSGWCIYTISGCKYCDQAKALLTSLNQKVKTINCDNYIQSLRDRDAFYAFINKYTIQDYKYFPMIFHNGKFIGGFKELMDLSGKSENNNKTTKQHNSAKRANVNECKDGVCVWRPK